MATWKCMRGSLACHALVDRGHSLKRFQRPVTFTSGGPGGAFGGGSDRGSTAQTLACKANVAPPKELFCNGGLISLGVKRVRVTVLSMNLVLEFLYYENTKFTPLRNK